MKKIALLHYSYPPSMGGVEILMQEQAHALASLGHDVRVLSGSGEESVAAVSLRVYPRLQSVMAQDKELQERFVSQGVVDDAFYNLASEIKAILDHELADREVIIVHNMLTLIHNLPFIHAFKTYRDEHPEKRVIVWAHDQTFIDQEKIITKKEGVSLNEMETALLMTPVSGATYVAISENFGKLFSEIMQIPFSEIKIIPNGINIQRFFQLDAAIWKVMLKEQLLQSYPLIFSPVNILQRKNLLYSLDVIAALKKDFPTIKYVITGKPSVHRSIGDHYEDLQKKIKTLQLEDTVVLLNEKVPGVIEHPTVRAFYTISDAVFYFSKSENSGLPLLESMLLKTPVFASNLDVFKEFGGDSMPYIDYVTVSPQEAADRIKSSLECDTKGLLHAKVRTEYNLQELIEKELIPLLT